MDRIRGAIEECYRQYYGRLTSALVYRFGWDLHDLVEDCVQEAFIEALNRWTLASPTRRDAWLYRVAGRLLMRKLATRSRPYDLGTINAEGAVEPLSTREIRNAQLRLLFAYADPSFSPKTQLVLIQKFLFGLKNNRIAANLLLEEASLVKMVQRARQRLIQEGQKALVVPLLESTNKRLPIALKALYLLFSEGNAFFRSREANEVLLEEALYLTKELLAVRSFKNADLHAIYAMQLFALARFEARYAGGAFAIDLENQDRSLWNQRILQSGVQELKKALFLKQDGYYQCEASIAYLHMSAADFSSTRWDLIASLYQKMYQAGGNPFIQLSRAIALFNGGQQKRAWKEWEELGQNAYIKRSKYYLQTQFYFLTKVKCFSAADVLSRILATDLHPEERIYYERKRINTGNTG